MRAPRGFAPGGLSAIVLDIGLVFGLVFGSLGCAGVSAPPADGAPPAALTDAEILGVLLAANHTQVAEANVAMVRAMTPPLLGWAEQAVNDHSLALSRLSQLGQQLVSADTDISRQLEAYSNRYMTDYPSVPDGRFPLICLCVEMQEHVRFLELVDNDLTPSIVNDSLRAEIATERSNSEDHLLETQNLLGMMGVSTASYAPSACTIINTLP
jgi:hypothetical protein